MELVTPKKLAARAAEHWRRIYESSRVWSLPVRTLPPHDDLPPKRETYEVLLALGPTPLAESVDKVIGNSSWTQTECSECGAENVPVVEMSGDDWGATSARPVSGRCSTSSRRTSGRASPKGG